MNHESIKQLRSSIESALVDKLGLYTFSNGIKERAIAVDLGNYPPQNTKIEGLEVVITPYKEINSTGLLNDFSDFEFYHEILLKQWSSTPSTDLIDSILIIRTLFGSRVQVGVRVLRLDDISTIESCPLMYLERKSLRHG